MEPKGEIQTDWETKTKRHETGKGKQDEREGRQGQRRERKRARTGREECRTGSWRVGKWRQRRNFSSLLPFPAFQR